MASPEMIIVGLNAVVVLAAYLVIYPKLAGSDGNKIAINDVMASAICLIVAGSLFWETGQNFNIIFTNVNWFWFTLLSYATIEIPFMIWYYNKHDMWKSLGS
jgi:hypothetical protein